MEVNKLNKTKTDLAKRLKLKEVGSSHRKQGPACPEH